MQPVGGDLERVLDLGGGGKEAVGKEETCTARRRAAVCKCRGRQANNPYPRYQTARVGSSHSGH